MNWDELVSSTPEELFYLDASLKKQFPPVLIDTSVTIGMAAYGNIDTTLFALRALFASVSGDYELILVDDASPDETGALFELVPLIHPNTKVFRFPRNIEYSGSLNTILSHANGEQIIFISNDIFVTPAYIEQLLLVSRQNPDFGLVRGCSNFVDNGLMTHTIKDCGELDNFATLYSYASDRAEAYDGSTLDDPFLTGDAFLVSRKVIDEIGFLDPRFFGYFVDHDLGLRARQAGFRPQLVLGAFVWHQHGANMDYLNPQAKEEKMRSRWARVNENWARFKDKYGLPVSLAYQGVRRIPWDGLATMSLAKKIPPCNNTAFCIPQPYTFAWNCYKASAMARQAKILMQAARLDDAKKLCQQALDIDGGCSEALTVLGSVLVYQGRVNVGIKTFRKAIKVDANNAKAHSNLLLSMNYSQDYTQQAIFRESRRWEKMHGSYADTNISARPARSRIRIAYISPDFRRHSVGYFFMPLLEKHDRNRFEIFCFSDVSTPDDITKQMVALADGWRDISGLTNDEVDVMIRSTRPDILVDLAGHTGQVMRLPLFARRLAAVQVSWLGYPNTTGLGTMDYRLTDEISDPVCAGTDLYYSEKLIRLPQGFLCYQPPQEAPEVSPLPMLAGGCVTFGSFNMLPKIQDFMISLWSEILHGTPNSRLILKNHFFRDSSAATRISHKFAQHGIKADKLILMPSDPGTAAHLAQYSQIDIALDTFPYNGTTTTCEALYMGVPVVTLAGNHHASRVGASILSRLGLHGLISPNREEYVNIAIQLAGNRRVLSKMRKTMRSTLRSSQLCNAFQFAEDLECSFMEMISSTQVRTR